MTNPNEHNFRSKYYHNYLSLFSSVVTVCADMSDRPSLRHKGFTLLSDSPSHVGGIQCLKRSFSQRIDKPL